MGNGQRARKDLEGSSSRSLIQSDGMHSCCAVSSAREGSCTVITVLMSYSFFVPPRSGSVSPIGTPSASVGLATGSE